MMKTSKKNYLMIRDKITTFFTFLKLSISILLKKKKEFISKIKTIYSKIETICVNFYVGYDIELVLQISLYLILFLWIFMQYTFYSDQIVQLNQIEKENAMLNNFYEDVIKGQTNKIENMRTEHMWIMYYTKVVFYGLGLSTYAFLMMWFTWR